MTTNHRTFIPHARAAALLLTAAIALPASADRANTPQPSDHALQQRLYNAFVENDFESALKLAQQLVDRDPENPNRLYSLAAAHAVLFETIEAEHHLKAAIEHGFIRLADLARDPRLQPIRNSATVRDAMTNWTAILDAAADAHVTSFKAETADYRYTFDENAELRLKKISAHPKEESSQAWDEIERVNTFVRAHFPSWLQHDEQRPPPWVFVVLPAEDHFKRLIANRQRVAGVYDHNQRQLVARDLGSSLRHEYFHALHWRHMEQLAQNHPVWIREGLAALPEAMTRTDTGTPAPTPNWRTNITRRRASLKSITDLERLASLDHRAFTGSHASTHYAEARLVMRYLHDQGQLADWYHRYTSTFDDDPTGLSALTDTLDTPLDDIQRDINAYAAQQPPVADTKKPFGPSLGVDLGQGAGSGPAVRTFGGVRGTRNPADTTDRLRYNDAIIAVDGVPTPTLQELIQLLGSYEPNADATLRVRRGRQHHTITLKLQPRDDD